MTRHHQPEAELQRAVLAHLHWRGVPNLFVFHYPAGGWRSPIEAAILRSLGTVAGIPDLLIVHHGQLYALELKAEYGRLTQTQIDTQARMRAAGAMVATAVEIDAALEQLTAWGLLRPDVSTQTARAFQQLRYDVQQRARRWHQDRAGCRQAGAQGRSRRRNPRLRRKVRSPNNNAARQ